MNFNLYTCMQFNYNYLLIVRKVDVFMTCLLLVKVRTTTNWRFNLMYIFTVNTRIVCIESIETSVFFLFSYFNDWLDQ